MTSEIQAYNDLQTIEDKAICGKAKAVRFSTLEAICKALDCQPGDILEFVKEEK